MHQEYIDNIIQYYTIQYTNNIQKYSNNVPIIYKKDNNIPIYDPKMGKNAFGFNINEIAGVTGSAKSKAAEFSQFVDVMEGNINTKAIPCC